MARTLDARPYDAVKLDAYLRVYEELFEKLADTDVRLLELGVLKGGSLRMWRVYFPRGIIAGLDITTVQSKSYHAARIQHYECHLAWLQGVSWI